MEQPRPHQSHSFLPQWRPLQAAARTVTLETRTVFVTIMYLPSGQSPPPTPCRTRRLPQARTSTESGTALTWPGTCSPNARTPSSFWNSCGEAEAVRPARSPERAAGDHLGTLSTSLPSLSSLPSPGSPSDPGEPLSQERVRGGPGSPCRHQGAKPGPQEPLRTPFSAATSWQGSAQGCSSPHREPPSRTGTSSPSLSAQRVPGSRCWGARSFPPNTNIHTQLQAAGQTVAAKARSTVLGKWEPLSSPQHRPGLELGQGGCRGVQTSGPGIF